jgi:hypothetical protein
MVNRHRSGQHADEVDPRLYIEMRAEDIEETVHLGAGCGGSYTQGDATS